MCGIIGYTGPLNAKDIVLDALECLEYRGYDSAGLALVSEKSNDIHIVKKTGKVANLKEVAKDMIPDSHIGIGHTRWATHGNVSDVNAHPHRAGKVVLIHNGIIENYNALIEQYDLRDKLVSQTDSEVAAHVLNQIYDGDPLLSISKFVRLIEGSYGFCILFEDKPGEIFCIRKVSPMVAAYSSAGAMVASDLTALIPYTKEYIVIPEDTLVRLTPYKLRAYAPDTLDIVSPEVLRVHWDMEAAMKNGYPHFMLKEIHEQPEALKNTIFPRLNKGLVDFSEDGISDALFERFQDIHIIACGTAMHTGLIARSLIQRMLRIPTEVSIASEFRYEDPLVNEHTLTIFISQSGETIDTLSAMRLAKEKGSTTLAIVNVKGSSISREADYVLYTNAGPEIAVASTKAYSVQLAALYMLIAKIGLVRGILNTAQSMDFISGLIDSIASIDKILEKKEEIRKITKKIISSDSAFYIGRGMDYASCNEGALKLKEISYIHAQAYAAGELKHGTIALISDHIPVVAIATQEDIYAKMISNIKEVKARNAYVILITKDGKDPSDDIYDERITIPEIGDTFSIFPLAVILQLIAYYAALEKGLDVDKPRNLAKSVTVE